MQLNAIHRDVAGLYVVITDHAGYPSAWTDEELQSYLTLVAGQALAGRRVIAAHSEARGLMAVALGAQTFGTGLVKSTKQYGARPSGGGGQRGQPPQPTASYFALPLLGVLHGERAQVLLSPDVLARVETSSRSFDGIILPELGDPDPASFDPAWVAPQGNLNAARAVHAAKALLSAEVHLSGATRPGDVMETWLSAAASVAQDVPPEAFQTAGLRNEIIARPNVYRQVRSALGI